MYGYDKSESESQSVVSDFLWVRGLYSPWNSPNQNTGVRSLSLLQGIFPTHGSNPGLLHFLPAEPQGKPKNTGVGSLPFSGGSSWPRNQIRVSCIAGGLFTNWSFREAHGCELDHKEGWDQRSDIFKLWNLRRFLRVSCIERISNQWILKEINPEYSLEGLMLKLKLQYFGHLMQSADSLGKTLILGKI